MRGKSTVILFRGVLAFSAIVATLANCGGNQSAFNPVGPQAERINDLWWVSFWISVVVWLLVVGFLAYALIKSSRRLEGPLPEPEGQQQMKFAVGSAAAATILILIGYLAYSIVTGRALAALPTTHALRIEIIGHQWWWEATYQDPVPSRQLTTANEIHIPVGEPVQIIGTAHDVIHSIWIPNLHGKKDVIPGHTTATWIRADRPGVYRGQCAEFCGLEHAKMAMLVVAEPRAEFDRWYASQLAPAPPPHDSTAIRGQQIFLSRSCAVCHTIAGTPAAGRVGPSLSHIGSSRTIGAGTLRNTRGNLAGWIVDPQSIKPGVRMPPNELPPAELNALVRYLEGLK